MSRALDSDTTASVQSDDNQNVYNDIANALCPNKPSLLEIEFLGKSHPLPASTNLLQDGSSIAVPKSKLVQAFLVAKQQFFNYLKPCPKDKHKDLLKATAVILLMDPEHLTAANARKRLIQTYQKAPKIQLEDALKRELLFVDSYLTSRLHRHTKSPTLWGHRRWVLQICNGVGMEMDLDKHLNDVVLIATERHPRNYYAWLHLRWLFRNCTHPGGKFLIIIKNWCLRHPGDTSGFSFLLFYLDFLGSSGVPCSQASSDICKEILALALSFKWTHESVWVFVRALVASRKVSVDERMDFFRTIEAVAAAIPDSSKALSILQRAQDWSVKHERKLES